MSDEYGCYRDTKEDFDELARIFKDLGNILFPYSEDNIGCIIVSLNRSFQKLGVMPFGGNPSGRIWVSVYGKGANHLSFKSEASYVEEKLSLPTQEAEWVARILAEIGARVGDT